MTSKCKLLIFAKAPLSGEAKTRLSPPLTAEEAATMAEAFLLDTLVMVGNVKLNADIIIYYTPETASDYFTHLKPDNWQIKPQQGRSLKMKITNAFRIEIGSTDQPVIIIGTDSPTLPPHYLTEAFNKLSKADLVIGPALDGGFYLIGMNKFYPELLKPVILSKPDSCEKLIESAARMELTFKMLPEWYDIDRFDDLKRINNPESVKYGFAAPRTKTLLASGRKANLEDLNLKAAGVHYNPRGITVNDYMRTSVKNIWAAGDCTGRYQFSHIAEVEAKAAVMNALFPLKRKVNYQGLPWATFTDPELAHLGLTEEECQEKNLKHKIYRQPFSGDDRAITEGSTDGMVKIIATPSGKIIGAHILGPRAGELINELVLARYKRIGLFALGQSIHVYPTLGLAVQRATDEWFAELAGRPPVFGLAKLFSNRM